jgi:hypothetical protein
MKEIKADGKGLKFDFRDEKTRLELVPPNLIEGIGRILTYGAKKYESDNWMRGIKFRRLIGAIKRHLADIELSNDLDDETNELHLYHIGCCIAFLSYYIEHPDEYADFDDRVFKPNTRKQHETQKTKSGRKISSSREEKKTSQKTTKEKRKSRKI